MDAGSCPECGKDVVAAQLRRRRPRPRLRRFFRGLVLVAVVLSVGFGLHAGYRYLNWPPWMSTPLLIVMAGSEESRATIELRKRMLAHRLSAQELSSFIKDRSGLRLELRQPYPAGVDIPAVLHCSLRFPLDSFSMPWRYALDGVFVSVDDQIETHVARAYPGWLLPYSSKLSIPIDLPPVAARRHHVRVRINMTIFEDVRSAPWGGGGMITPFLPKPDEFTRSVLSWTMAAETDVDLDDKPLDEFARPVWSAELQEKFTKSISAGKAAGSDIRNTLLLDSERLPEPVVGTVWARVAGRDTFHRVYELLTDRLSGGIRQVVFLSGIPGIEAATHVDVRIVSNDREAAEQAVKAGLDRYFAGVIEILNVPIEKEGRFATFDERVATFGRPVDEP